jgi:hypothetical protein
LLGELRLVPGDITHQCDKLGRRLYSTETYDVYECLKGKSFTENHTRLVSLGLALNF